MDYASKMIMLFIGILIFLIYLIEFTLLNGAKGFISWLVLGACFGLVIAAKVK